MLIGSKGKLILSDGPFWKRVGMESIKKDQRLFLIHFGDSHMEFVSSYLTAIADGQFTLILNNLLGVFSESSDIVEESE